jgi:hypothetical protein
MGPIKGRNQITKSQSARLDPRNRRKTITVATTAKMTAATLSISGISFTIASLSRSQDAVQTKFESLTASTIPLPHPGYAESQPQLAKPNESPRNTFPTASVACG